MNAKFIQYSGFKTQFKVTSLTQLQFMLPQLLAQMTASCDSGNSENFIVTEHNIAKIFIL